MTNKKKVNFKHYCSVCNKDFKTEYTLNVHMNSKTHKEKNKLKGGNKEIFINKDSNKNDDNINEIETESITQTEINRNNNDTQKKTLLYIEKLVNKINELENKINELENKIIIKGGKKEESEFEFDPDETDENGINIDENKIFMDKTENNFIMDSITYFNLLFKTPQKETQEGGGNNIIHRINKDFNKENRKYIIKYMMKYNDINKQNDYINCIMENLSRIEVDSFY
jgi:hypothetical protein